MKVRLTRQNRIDGEAGDIVEVSPARSDFLLYCEIAEPVTEAGEQAKPQETQKKGKGKK